MAMPLPRLYAHPFSSYCQKVIIAFYEKALPFEFRLVSAEQPAAAAELRALWPLERFPVLVSDDGPLLESSIIIEWLDLHAPERPRLIPADPHAALRVRMLDRIFDNYVMTPMQAIVFDRIRPEDARDPYGVDRARHLLDRTYAWLNRELEAGEWAAGGEFGLADCAAAPALFYANWVHPIEGHDHLSGYLQRLCARPSFARAIDEARPYRQLFPVGVPDYVD